MVVEREFMFGPLGAMEPLALEPGVSVAAGRSTSEFLSGGGVRWVRSGALNPRTWAGKMTLQDQGAVRLLDLAVQAPGLPMFLYDTMCARRNLLPARDAFGIPASRVNMVPNPGWESGLTQAGAAPVFAPSTGSTVAIATDWFDRGTQSLKASGWLTSDALCIFGPKAGTLSRLGLLPGRTYTLGVTVRVGPVTLYSSDTPDSPLFTIGLQTTFGGVYDTYQISRALTAREQITRLAFTFTIPEGATEVSIVMSRPGGSRATCWLDSFTLEAGVTDGSYFDGATPGYGWAGAANASLTKPAGVLTAGIPLPPVPWLRREAYVLAGRVYTLSAWTSGTLFPLSYQLPGGAVVNMPAPVGGLSQVSFTPAVSGVLSMTRIGTKQVAGVRVHEGVPDGLFFAAEGTPSQVVATDPGRTHQLLAGRSALSDYDIQLQEVGVPGRF